jgi:calcineurin-like phosphoesterase family protein
MSHNTFFISDTHFGHAKTTDGTFVNHDGSNLRPFGSVEEMDEAMVANWNDVVADHDKVYVLGDCVIGRKHLNQFRRLKGHKRLIRGNHDIFKTQDYVDVGFKEIYGVRVLEDCILSHIPLHQDCITTRFGVNVHGHLHGNRIMAQGYTTFVDPRYFSVCVEKIDYTPLEYGEMRDRIRAQFDAIGWSVPPRLKK